MSFTKYEYELLNLVREFLSEHIDDLDFYIDRTEYGFEVTWFQHSFMRWVLRRYGHVVDTNKNDPELGTEKMDWIIRTMNNMKVQIKSWCGLVVNAYTVDLKYYDKPITRPDIFLWIFPIEIFEDIVKVIHDEGFIYEHYMISQTKKPMVVMISKRADLAR